jgi:hypothetical protein
MNEIGNALAMPVEDPTSNNILCTALEVCNTGGHQKKTETPFNHVLVFHFQKGQRRFHWIVARCGCRELVAEDVDHMAPASQDFGAESSFATRTSSAGSAQDDDVPDLGPDLNTMTDVLSHLEDAPNLMQPSQTL